MSVRSKYNRQRQGSAQNSPLGGGRVFVSEKVKYPRNPIVNLPTKFWGNVGLLLVIVFLFWFVLYSPFFKLKEVIVEGNKQVPSAEIVKIVNTKNNIFRVNTKVLKNNILQANPIIKDVIIYRGIPDALKIVVLEKNPVVVWTSSDSYYLLDEEGYIDRKINANEFSELIRVTDQKNLPVTLGSQVVSPNFINFVQKINGQFYDSTNIKLSKLEVWETTFDIYAYTEAGFFVKFDTSRSPDKQLEDLKNILVSHRETIREYVDVRINGWAYFK